MGPTGSGFRRLIIGQPRSWVEAVSMGYGEYEAGGLLKVLGALVIIIGIGLAGYLVYLNRSYWLFAAVIFLVFLVLGAVMVSRGGYTRKQNTPMGRVEDAREK
jgi:ABC-type siderophore export system fused ATPase/permease subunit